MAEGKPPKTRRAQGACAVPPTAAGPSAGAAGACGLGGLKWRPTCKAPRGRAVARRVVESKESGAALAGARAPARVLFARPCRCACSFGSSAAACKVLGEGFCTRVVFALGWSLHVRRDSGGEGAFKRSVIFLVYSGGRRPAVVCFDDRSPSLHPQSPEPSNPQTSQTLKPKTLIPNQSSNPRTLQLRTDFRVRSLLGSV